MSQANHIHNFPIGTRVRVDISRGGEQVDSSIHVGGTRVQKTGTVTELIGDHNVWVDFDDGDFQVCPAREGDTSAWPVYSVARI